MHPTFIPIPSRTSVCFFSTFSYISESNHVRWHDSNHFYFDRDSFTRRGWVLGQREASDWSPCEHFRSNMASRLSYREISTIERWSWKGQQTTYVNTALCFRLNWTMMLFCSLLVERQKETVSEAADKVQKRKLGSFQNWTVDGGCKKRMIRFF